jgi:hypothetical protein
LIGADDCEMRGAAAVSASPPDEEPDVQHAGGYQTRPSAIGGPVAPRIAYLDGLAAIVGGALFVAHGVLVIAWDSNLDALPLSLLLFSVGLVGLRRAQRCGAGAVSPPSRFGRL